MNKRGKKLILRNRNINAISSFVSKKAQVATFIIIGIIILAAVITIIYFVSSGNFLNIFNDKERDSVDTYTEACFEQVAKQGVFVLSTSGGYINIPDRYIDQGAYIDVGGRVPYWYYDGFDRVPSPESVEEQLEKYIDKNIYNCLNNYDSFKDRYKVTMNNEPQSDVTITNEKIHVVSDFYISIETIGTNNEGTGSITDSRKFVVDFDSVFGKNFNLAKRIMELENEMSFLEDYTDEMIAASDYLPYEGALLSCSPKIWMENDLKEYTKELVMHNLNFLMFEGTKYMETGMLYYDKLYKIPLYTKNEKTYKDTSVKIIYNPNWETDFKVSPSKSGVVKAFEMKLGDVVPMCMQVMHHKYTMEYPVVFQITDSDYPDEPFIFSTPVMLKNSMPNRKDEAPNFLKVSDEFSEKEFCQETLNYTYFKRDENNFLRVETARIEGMKNSLDIYAIDMLEGFPNGILTNANISYQCVDFRCNLGNTNYPISDEGLLTAGYPLYEGLVPDCINGMVIAEKEGYYRGITQYTSSTETSGDQVNVELYPLKTVNYGITVVEEHNGVIIERGLEEGEKVVINLRNKNLTEFEETVIIPSKIGYYRDLRLPMGEEDMYYDLDIKLVQNDQYVGGLLSNWTIETNDLYSSTFITFYAIKKEPRVPPSTAEEWQAIVDYSINNSINYPPEII